MTNFLKAILMFIDRNEVLLEIVLYIARRVFGNGVVDQTIAFVKEASLQLKTGKEKFDIVKAKLESSVEPLRESMKDQKFWLNLLIEIVVAYLKITKKIQ